MSVISNRQLMILLVSILMALAHNANALVVPENCGASSDNDFFNLTAFEAAPYIPSVDEEGNSYLSGPALANAEINHYRNQYKNAPLVRMPIDRYAAVTSERPDSLKNFESRLVIIDPDCNELKLFFGTLIGTSKLSFENYLQIVDTAERLAHKPLTEFNQKNVKLHPKPINQLFDILKSDLKFDVSLVKKALGDDFVESMGINSQNDFMTGGELALLAYAKKGGRIDGAGANIQAFIILPSSVKGLTDLDKTLILLSSGVVHVVHSLNTALARLALEQLGVSTTILKTDRLYNSSGPVCLLDEVGHWYRMNNGGRKRNCNFNQALIQSLQTGGWQMTFDENLTPISYQRIKDIMAQNVQLEIAY